MNERLTQTQKRLRVIGNWRGPLKPQTSSWNVPTGRRGVGKEPRKGKSAPSLWEFKEVSVVIPPGCSRGRRTLWSQLPFQARHYKLWMWQHGGYLGSCFGFLLETRKPLSGLLWRPVAPCKHLHCKNTWLVLHPEQSSMPIAVPAQGHRCCGEVALATDGSGCLLPPWLSAPAHLFFRNVLGQGGGMPTIGWRRCWSEAGPLPRSPRWVRSPDSGAVRSLPWAAWGSRVKNQPW